MSAGFYAVACGGSSRGQQRVEEFGQAGMLTQLLPRFKKEACARRSYSGVQERFFDRLPDGGSGRRGNSLTSTNGGRYKEMQGEA
jgi:hypothetical protein